YHIYIHGTTPSHIYTLSLHDALPISVEVEDGTEEASEGRSGPEPHEGGIADGFDRFRPADQQQDADDEEDHREGDGGSPDRRLADRKSTRLNSSHRTISYAVFCLKKK